MRKGPSTAARRRAAAALLAGAALAALVRPVSVSAQSAGPTLQPGDARSLTAAGVALQPVADGRVHSYGVVAQVRGVAFSARAGTGAEAVFASPGTELTVVHVTFTFPVYDQLTSPQAPLDTLTVTLQSGGTSATLVSSGLTPSDAYFAADIPAAGAAVLTVAAGGLSQSLDLRTGQRPPPAPTVLYRSDQDTVVRAGPAPPHRLVADSSDGMLLTAQAAVRSATLSYWQPGTTTFATAPDQAFLDVVFAPVTMASAGVGAAVADNLPGSAVELIGPDGQAMAAVHPTPPTNGLLDGDYFFAVPADLRTAQIEVDPASGVPAVLAFDAGEGAPRPVTLAFAEPATFALTFPTASSAAGPAPARTALPRLAAARRLAADGLIAGAAGLVLLAGVVALVWRLRRPKVGAPAADPRVPVARHVRRGGYSPFRPVGTRPSGPPAAHRRHTHRRPPGG